MSLSILQVITAISPKYGGPSQVIQEMSGALAARGHTINLITTDADWGDRLKVPLRSPIETNGYRVWYYPCRYPARPHLSMELPMQVALMARKCDLIHIHGIFTFPTTASMALLRTLNRPYVIRTCGILDRYGMSQKASAKQIYLKLFERKNIEKAAFIQVSTEQEKHEVEYWGYKNPIRILPQGVNQPIGSARSRLLQEPYILHLGRVARKKRIDLTLHALKLLNNKWPKLVLIVAGADEAGYQKELELLASTIGVASRVKFVGIVRGEEKSRWLRDAEAFVLASEDENFGVAVVEAACLKTPVIVSREVALSTEVEKYNAGLVVERNANSVALAIENIISKGRENWSSGCTNFAMQFTWKEAAARLEAAYKNVLVGL